MTGSIESVRRRVTDLRPAGTAVLRVAAPPAPAAVGAARRVTRPNRPRTDAPRWRWSARWALPRRLWSALGAATQHLATFASTRPDERAVADACLRAAAVLAAADQAEITIKHPGGRVRRYQLGSGPTARLDSAPGSTPHGGPARAESAGARVWLVRALSVGAAELGELRLRVHRDRCLPADQHALSIFATAAASVLHQAAIGRRVQAMAARSAYDSVHDPLTGLMNRSAFLLRAASSLRRVDRGTPVGLLLIDVDGQRAVNATLGHSAGDQLLTALARRLHDELRPGELLGRVGNDEFAMLIIGQRGESHPIVRSRVVTAAVTGRVEVDGVTIAAEVNAGLAVEGAGDTDLTELLRRGEVALHQAKVAGAPVVCYEAAGDSFSADRLALLAELRDALSSRDQLTLSLQPTVDLLRGAPVGAEVLVRWRHPRRGMLAATEFIAAIDHSDLAADFTAHVASAALDVASGWASQGLRVPVSVNLCARCTLNPELPAGISRLLASRGVAPQRLVVEISEAVLTQRRELAERVIRELRAQGVRVCVDDFGTASASLAFLTTFSVDQVKIPSSFVASMLESPRTAAIVRTTVEMARDLGLRVVAKGVERVEQRDALLGLGVTEAQGYLFHPPMPVAEATAALQAMVHRATAGSIPVVRVRPP